MLAPTVKALRFFKCQALLVTSQKLNTGAGDTVGKAQELALIDDGHPKNCRNRAGMSEIDGTQAF
jgi:hypothetical protein